MIAGGQAAAALEVEHCSAILRTGDLDARWHSA
jgi:hypothetical protein